MLIASVIPLPAPSMVGLAFSLIGTIGGSLLSRERAVLHAHPHHGGHS